MEVPFVGLETENQGLSNSKVEEKTPASNATARARRIMLAVEESESTFRRWRAMAEECQRFYDGHQWEDFDRKVMEQSKRPALTFNEVKKVIRGICGLERLNRTEPRFITRPLDSSLEQDTAGELATEACSSVDQLCNAGFEFSLAVKDFAIRGMGWMETRMSFERDLDGEIVKDRLPADEMRWDPHSRRPGLVDARWRARKRNMPRALFEERWPDMISQVEGMAGDTNLSTVDKWNRITPGFSRANQQANPGSQGEAAPKDTILVIQYQEVYQATVYRYLDPENPGELQEFNKDEWMILKTDFEANNLPLPEHVEQKRTKVRQFYIANGVELEDPVDLPGDMYSLNCLTGEWDEERKCWVGIVPEMLDPQKTKNKSISAGLNFYLSNAKGGVLVESGAFVNPRKAKEDWSSANAWIEMNPNSIKEQKIMPRAPTEMPTALAAFFELGTRGIIDVTGVNLEMLGMEQGEVGSGTQKARLASGLAIFGWFFDEINRFKIELARVTLAFVQDFLTDGRLIMVGGNFNGQAIPLLREKLPMKYSLAIDESVKHNPNLKSQLWNDILPILPAVIRFGGIQALLYLMKFSPYPAQMVAELQKMAQQQGQQQQPGQKPAEDPKLTEAKIRKTDAEAKRNLAQGKILETQSYAKLAELFQDSVKMMLEDERERLKLTNAAGAAESDKKIKLLELFEQLATDKESARQHDSDQQEESRHRDEDRRETSRQKDKEISVKEKAAKAKPAAKPKPKAKKGK